MLSVLAALDHLLLPSVRWFMRRRLNRAIEELNTRLKLRIQPFKLAKRQALIDQLIFDPEVLREIEEYAARQQASRARPRRTRAPLRARDRAVVLGLRLFRHRHARWRAGSRPCSIACASATWTRRR